MTTARKVIQQAVQRVFLLRHDSKYEELILETIRHMPELNKLLVTNKLSIESARELAYKAVESFLVLEVDNRQMVSNEDRYDDHIDLVFRAVTTHPVAEQRDAFRAWFRFMHSLLKVNLSLEDAYRVFVLVAPSQVDALVSLQQQLENAIELVSNVVDKKEKNDVDSD